MFASMTFRREHFWRGSDNSDQLLRILKTLGTDKFDLYLQKYDINFETENDALLARSVHALPVETDELTRTAVTQNGAGRSM